MFCSFHARDQNGSLRNFLFWQNPMTEWYAHLLVCFPTLFTLVNFPACFPHGKLTRRQSFILRNFRQAVNGSSNLPLLLKSVLFTTPYIHMLNDSILHTQIAGYLLCLNPVGAEFAPGAPKICGFFSRASFGCRA